mgnify:CR=1 FL=1
MLIHTGRWDEPGYSYAVLYDAVVDEILGNHGRIYNAFPDPHGKKAVRIASKGSQLKKFPHRPMICPVISPRIPVSAIEKKD